MPPNIGLKYGINKSTNEYDESYISNYIKKVVATTYVTKQQILVFKVVCPVNYYLFLLECVTLHVNPKDVSIQLVG